MTFPTSTRFGDPARRIGAALSRLVRLAWAVAALGLAVAANLAADPSAPPPANAAVLTRVLQVAGSPRPRLPARASPSA